MNALFFLLLFVLGLSHANGAEYLVKLKAGIDQEQKKHANKNNLTDAVLLWESLKILSADRQVSIAQIRGTGFHKLTISTSASALKRTGLFSIVEPNYKYKLLGMTGERINEKSWWHLNFGQADSMGQVGFPGADVKSFSLWNRGYVGSRNIKVAILDSGVDFNHQNLRENIMINQNEIPGNGVDDDKNGYVDDVYGWNFINHNNNPMDTLGHGTHVAGIVGATGYNRLGISGVNQQVSILPVKVTDDEGYGTIEQIIEGMAYARSRGVQIMNASLGGDPYSEAFFEELKRLNQQKILFVAAAGNDNMDNDEVPFYPASYNLPNVLSVAANDNRDLKADFSHYGVKSVHISAPGVLITSTTPKDNFNSFSGTSMSAPFVAGGVALLMSVFPQEDIFQIRDRLLISCDPAYPLKRMVTCGGRMNLENAYLNKKSEYSDPDESLWVRQDFMFESFHPYQDGLVFEQEFYFKDAKYIRLHFSKIETEQFDKIYLSMGSGKLIEVLSGERNNYFSEPIPGDKVIISLKPDLSLAKFGFIIDYVEVIK